MFFVVLGHYIYNYVKLNSQNSNFEMDNLSEVVNYTFLEMMMVISSTGVDLFELITGYFLINRQTFRVKGMLNVMIMTIFYSICIYVVFTLFHIEAFSFKEILHCMEPIPLSQYWFVAKYIGLLFLAPFLSILTSQLSKRVYQILLLVLFILFFEWPYGNLYGGGMSINWFCFLFLCGGYLQKHGIPYRTDRQMVVAIVIACFIFVFHTAINMIAYLRNGSPFTIKYDGNHSITFFLALAIFLFFAKTSFNGSFSKHVARIAPYTFAVYLIHGHSVVSAFLWEQITPVVFSSLPLFFHALLLSALVFLGAILIDCLRDRLFKAVGIQKVIDYLGLQLSTKIFEHFKK